MVFIPTIAIKLAEIQGNIFSMPQGYSDLTETQVFMLHHATAGARLRDKCLCPYAPTEAGLQDLFAPL